MKLESAKEQEQGSRMRRHLVDAGFVKTGSALAQEVWTLGTRRVVLTRVHPIHNPIEAEVYDPRFRPNVEFAFNAKGLAILLARMSNAA